MSTEHGFRDLFVELPRQLFDALKGIGEQAVREAQRPGTVETVGPMLKMLYATETPSINELLRARYGWRRLAISRSAMDASLIVSVKPNCGHPFYFAIDEGRVYASSSMPFALLDALDEHSRDRVCYCVPREAP